MRRTLVALGILMVLGILAYFGGYHLYLSGNSKTESAEELSLQKGVQVSEADGAIEPRAYYLVKIEREMLMVYEMPEKILYDSVETGSLHLQERERAQLLCGVLFPGLTEVFEFLENSMS